MIEKIASFALEWDVWLCTFILLWSAAGVVFLANEDVDPDGWITKSLCVLIAGPLVWLILFMYGIYLLCGWVKKFATGISAF